MKVLFASYGSTDNNSGYQILELARGLRDRELQVAIATPKILAVPPRPDPWNPGILHFKEALLRGREDRWDIIHAWTPRENVRRFVTAMLIQHPSRLVVHMEDNEDAIRHRILPGAGVDAIPDGLMSPIAGRWLLGVANGITVIHPDLSVFAPPGTATHHLLPSVDFLFFSGVRDASGPGDGGARVCYAGNVNAVNFEDFAILCDAVRELNRGGTPVTLVKTGRLPDEFLDRLGDRSDLPIDNLGWIDRADMPAAIASADICVQPGNKDEFNDFRLPSKIPEILASGIPLITGACNIGPLLRQHGAAVVLDKMDARSLGAQIRLLVENPDLAAGIASCGLEFARRHFGSGEICGRLEHFYHHLPEGRTITERARSEPAARHLLDLLESEKNGRVGAAPGASGP